jgi:hypothetical protein
MLVRFGIRDASVEQPGVQLLSRVRLSPPRGQAPFGTRSYGVKNRSRTIPTWFSTGPSPGLMPACKQLVQPDNARTSVKNGG